MEEEEKINKLKKYEQKIKELEVSSDTSDNLNKVQTYIQSVIETNDNLSQNDIAELIKVATEHFSFAEEAKEELITFCEKIYRSTDLERKEKTYQASILRNAKQDKRIDPVFPAIDYRLPYGMIYGVKSYDEQGNQKTYIGTANKKIYEIEVAKVFGIITTHEEQIDSKCSLSNFKEYVEGKNVTASGLFNQIKNFFNQYVVVLDNFIDVIVTYIMMSYVYMLFQVIPYLWFNGEKGTGKSTIMKIMSKLCFNSLFCSNVNPANIFRQIDNDGSTIILDEFEKMYGEDKQEVIKILNQGFNADGVVPRCVGQSNQIKKFRSFSPKIMGGISNIDDVLFERCIKYTTKRVKDVTLPKYRESDEVKKVLNELVDNLYIFGFIYAPKIKEVYDNSEVGFKGYSLREDDLWNPLLCIAKVIDEENNNTAVTDNLLNYAKKLSDEKFKRNLENEPKLQLLYYLYEYFNYYSNANVSIELNDGRKGIEIADLFEYLSNKDEFSWIKNKSSLGKYLTQWYSFEKKREVGKSKGDKELSIKRTYYIFTKDDILKIMEDNHIKVADYE